MSRRRQKKVPTNIEIEMEPPRSPAAPSTPKAQVYARSAAVTMITPPTPSDDEDTGITPLTSTTTTKKLRPSPEMVLEMVQQCEESPESLFPTLTKKLPKGSTATLSTLVTWLTKVLGKPSQGDVLHLAVLNLHRTAEMWSKKTPTEAYPIAAACVWTASKYHHGPNSMTPEEVIRMLPKQYRITPEMLIPLESHVCKTLNFRLHGTTTHTFFAVYADMLELTSDDEVYKVGIKILNQSLSRALGSISVPLLAAGVIYAANVNLSIKPPWPPVLRKCTKFLAKDVSPVAEELMKPKDAAENDEEDEEEKVAHPPKRRKKRN
eukprot:PhF_6_TR30379/c0_g1_i1/m.44514